MRLTLCSPGSIDAPLTPLNENIRFHDLTDMAKLDGPLAIGLDCVRRQ